MIYKYHITNFLKWVLMTFPLFGQEFLDPYNVHSIDINFYNTNYNQILEDRWEDDDKTYELARVICNGDTLDSVGVRYKGNSTYFETHANGSIKYPLNMDFDIVYDDQELFGHNKLKLSNSIFDPTFVKEAVGYISSGYYLPTPDVGYTTVTINEEYLGLYTLVESINKPYLTKHFGNSEGTFFKCEPLFQFGEWYDAWPNLVWYGNDSMAYEYQMGYELKSEHGWDDLLDLIETLNNNPENIGSILNVDRVLWFFASSIVMPDLDTYNGIFVHNYYLYKNTDTGRFEILPWDKNNTFGGSIVNIIINWWFGNVTWIYNWDPFGIEDDATRPLFVKLMENPLYKKTYTAHMRTIIDDIYNVEFFGDLTSGIQEVIEPYAGSYPNILPFFNTGDYFEYNVHNYLDGPSGDYCGITSTLEPRLQYLLGHNQISKVAPEIYFVNQDISEPEPGEQVVITAAVTGAESVELMVQNQALNGQFFSIEMYDDGNSGDGDEGDIIYGATIPFNSSGDQVRYYIRASNDDALVLEPRQAEWEYYHFVVGNVLADTNIVINEINYHSSDEYDSGDWIELYNPTSSQVNISGYVFKDEDNDHEFLIPNNTILESEEFIVLCNDLALFNTVFPEVNNVLGDFDFGLSGGGELIRIFNAANVLIDTVHYDDDLPWPQEADGNGPTLELMSPFLANDLAENWSSSEGLGTPGTINSVFLNNDSRKSLPSNIKLSDNYPNPFNPYTTIEYQLDITQRVNVSIYDLLGRRIKTLVNDIKNAGQHTIQWDAKDSEGLIVAGGVYLYQIQTDSYNQSKKMVYLK